MAKVIRTGPCSLQSSPTVVIDEEPGRCCRRGEGDALMSHTLLQKFQYHPNKQERSLEKVTIGGNTWKKISTDEVLQYFTFLNGKFVATN